MGNDELTRRSEAPSAAAADVGKGIVIIRFDERGEIEYTVAGSGVRFFIVDERAPNDRVYEWTPRVDARDACAILGDDPIGSSRDDRHPAIAARIKEHIDGTPRLKVVSDDHAAAAETPLA